MKSASNAIIKILRSPAHHHTTQPDFTHVICVFLVYRNISKESSAFFIKYPTCARSSTWFASLKCWSLCYIGHICHKMTSRRPGLCCRSHTITVTRSISLAHSLERLAVPETLSLVQNLPLTSFKILMLHLWLLKRWVKGKILADHKPPKY
jgi:hypothetical protein